MTAMGCVGSDLRGVIDVGRLNQTGRVCERVECKLQQATSPKPHTGLAVESPRMPLHACVVTSYALLLLLYSPLYI